MQRSLHVLAREAEQDERAFVLATPAQRAASSTQVLGAVLQNHLARALQLMHVEQEVPEWQQPHRVPQDRLENVVRHALRRVVDADVPRFRDHVQAAPDNTHETCAVPGADQRAVAEVTAALRRMDRFYGGQPHA